MYAGMPSSAAAAAILLKINNSRSVHGMSISFYWLVVVGH
jgi:hypothetical protein